MVQVTRLHHIGIYVSSLETALRFYRDSLGLPVVYEGPRVTLLAAGDNHIELIEPGAESPLRRRPTMEWEGTNHVAFETPDLASALIDLSQRGISLRDESPRSLPAYLFAYLANEVFDGVSVELVQVTAPATAFAHDEVIGFDRVIFSFPYADVAVSRFEEYLGLASAVNRDNDTGRKINLVMAGNCRLELVEQLPLHPETSTVTANIGGFMLAVRGLVALRERLQAADIPVSEIFADGRGRRFAYVHGSVTGRVPFSFLETEPP